jgi:hypothetical protein
LNKKLINIYIKKESCVLRVKNWREKRRKGEEEEKRGKDKGRRRELEK